MLRLVKAWPHEWVLHPFWSSAGPAKGPTGRQFGSRVIQVWPKGRSKRSLLEKRGTWPKPLLFIMFSYCFGGPWQALGSSRAPLEALLEARGRPVPAQGHKGSIGIYGNGRKPVGTDANGRKFSQTQPGSEVKVYLKAKTYDSICSIY